MKNSIILVPIILLIFCSTGLSGQDRFPVRQLTSDPAQEGFATWSPDGKFIIFQHTDMYDTVGKNGLWRIPAEGGEAEQIFKGLAEHPKWSPDGRWIVFDADTGNSIAMIPAAGGDAIRFLPDTIPVRNGGLPCWSPDGTRIAFVGGSLRSLYIADIITGKFNRIFSQEGTIPLPGCWTKDGEGILVALMEMPSRKSTIWKISADGKEKKQITGHHESFYRHIALSPDGEWLVYAVLQDRALGLWIMPSEGGKSLPLTITPGNHNEGASWSPDGTKLTFTSTRSGSFDIWMMDIDRNKLRSDLELARMDGESITLGTYRTIHSNILNEDRLLWVHLPKEYEDTRLAYPVLYLLYVDIYNYFTDAVSITEKLGETGEIPPVIIVGVANTNRYRDLLPYPTRWAPEGGKAGDFLRFLEKELIPFADSNYRTKEFRILAAPQASAVFSLYSLINRPYLFDATIAQNPFMNLENAEKLYPLAEEFFSTAGTLKHLFYVACEKDDRPEELEYMERFTQLPGVKTTEGFRFVMDMQEPSGYFIPPLPFRTALRTLFPGYKLPDEFQADSLQDILDYYQERSKAYGFAVDPPEHMLTFEGDEMIQRGKTLEAIDVFTYQLGLYPKSLNAIFRLGETYRAMGDYKTARNYYQKFLDIRSTDAARIQQRITEMDSLINDQ